MITLPVTQQLVATLVGFPEKCAGTVFSAIRPDMLPDGIDREIFEKCLEFYKDGSEISFISLGDKEQIVRVADALGGQYFYHDIRLMPIIKNIVESYERRELQKAIIKANDMIAAGKTVESAIAVIENVKDKIFKKTNSAFITLKDLVEKYWEEQQYLELTESVLNTRWPKFDNDLVFKNGDLVVLAGRPAMGKTDFALQMTKRVAGSGVPVGVFSLEMKSPYLLRRLANGGQDYESYLEGCKDIVDLPIVINDSPVQTALSAHEQVRYAIREHGIKLAVFDYLTLMDTEKSQNRNLEIEKLVKDLKQSALKNGIPYILLAQLSRAVEKRTDKKPMLSDLRDSGGIEQNVDMALFLYRPGYYKLSVDGVDDDDIENYLQLIIGKQRDGRTGVLEFFYDKERKKIEEWGRDQLGYQSGYPQPSDIPF